jgi:NTP pyrophosphatase (non-canonical NTP hydrolase)
VETDVGTAAQDNLQPGWMYYVLGLGGETGEIFEKIKKLFRDDEGKMSPERLKDIELEMGDALWYLTRLADVLGIDLADVAHSNLAKLQSRKKRNKLHGDGDHR